MLASVCRTDVLDKQPGAQEFYLAYTVVSFTWNPGQARAEWLSGLQHRPDLPGAWGRAPVRAHNQPWNAEKRINVSPSPLLSLALFLKSKH